MTYFVSLDSVFASDATTEKLAIEEATVNFIERLQRSQQGEKDQVEWLVEEEDRNSFPWDDGVLSDEEFVELLKNGEQKKAFWKLPLEEQSSVLHASAPEGSEAAEQLDKLAKYIDGWFRKTALKKAADIGLSEQDADNIMKAWTLGEED